MLLHIALLSYSLAIVWIFLFPAVNISSGEAKPRSFFVDEHSLLVNTARFPSNENDVRLINSAMAMLDSRSTLDRLKKAVEGRNKLNLDIMCEFISKETNAECVLSTLGIADSIYVVRPLRGLHHKLFLESIDVVIRYDSGTVADAAIFAGQLSHIISKVNWLSKAVTIFLLPTEKIDALANDRHNAICSSRSECKWESTFQQASDSYYSQQLQCIKFGCEGLSVEANSTIIDGTLTRGAFVFDLRSAAHKHGKIDRNIIENTKDVLSVWDEIDMNYVGSNGVLPNMDVVATAIALGDDIHTLNSYDTSPSHSRNRKQDPCKYTSVCRLLSQLLLQQQPSASDAKASNKQRKDFGYTSDWMWGYLYRLDCLLNAFWSSATVGPSPGLHAQYLTRNIEAITLIPKAGNSNNRLQNRQSKQIDARELVSVAVSMIRTFSNLEEELHHSLFYYIAMGNRHFVGINEYGFSILLALVPSLLLVHLLWANLRSLRQSHLAAAASRTSLEAAKEKQLKSVALSPCSGEKGAIGKDSEEIGTRHGDVNGNANRSLDCAQSSAAACVGVVQCCVDIAVVGIATSRMRTQGVYGNESLIIIYLGSRVGWQLLSHMIQRQSTPNPMGQQERLILRAVQKTAYSIAMCSAIASTAAAICIANYPLGIVICITMVPVHLLVGYYVMLDEEARYQTILLLMLAVVMIPLLLLYVASFLSSFALIGIDYLSYIPMLASLSGWKQFQFLLFQQVGSLNGLLLMGLASAHFMWLFYSVF